MSPAARGRFADQVHLLRRRHRQRHPRRGRRVPPGPGQPGNPVELSILDPARRIRDLCASASPVTFVARPVIDPGLWRPDITLARMALGWQPEADFDEGPALTIDWFSRLG